MELYLQSPNTPSWRGAQLKKKHRDKFTSLIQGEMDASVVILIQKMHVFSCVDISVAGA
jgi:hypothetical protein